MIEVISNDGSKITLGTFDNAEDVFKKVDLHRKMYATSDLLPKAGSSGLMASSSSQSIDSLRERKVSDDVSPKKR